MPVDTQMVRLVSEQSSLLSHQSPQERDRYLPRRFAVESDRTVAFRGCVDGPEKVAQGFDGLTQQCDRLTHASTVRADWDTFSSGSARPGQADPAAMPTRSVAMSRASAPPVTDAIWYWVPSRNTLSSAKLRTEVFGPFAAYGSTA